MSRSWSVRRARVVAAVAVVASLAAAGDAAALETPVAAPETWQEVQAQIDEQLRTTRGGVQTAIDTVSYQGGEVQVVFPRPPARSGAQTAAPPCPASPDVCRQMIEQELEAQSQEPDVPTNWAAEVNDSGFNAHGCPSGLFTHWYCFWEHANYGGRRLQFKGCEPTGKTQHFSDWSFQRQTTSWANTAYRAVIDVYGDGDRLLWKERPRMKKANVGSLRNDRAVYFTCYGRI